MTPRETVNYLFEGLDFGKVSKSYSAGPKVKAPAELAYLGSYFDSSNLSLRHGAVIWDFLGIKGVVDRARPDHYGVSVQGDLFKDIDADKWDIPRLEAELVKFLGAARIYSLPLFTKAAELYDEEGVEPMDKLLKSYNFIPIKQDVEEYGPGTVSNGGIVLPKSLMKLLYRDHKWNEGARL